MAGGQQGLSPFLPQGISQSWPAPGVHALLESMAQSFLSTLLLPTCNSQTSSFPQLLFCCLKILSFGVSHAVIPPSISPESKVHLLVSCSCLLIADLLLGCGKAPALL